MSELSTPFQKVLYGRRSIRCFQGRAVARASIESVIQAALQAPSAHNRQPWRFVVLPNDEQLELLARRMGQQLQEDLKADGLDPAAIENRVRLASERILRAPVNLVVCLDKELVERPPDERRSRAEYLMAVQGVAMAGQNLLLAAHAAGLGACWLCAPLFVPELIRESLGLPQHWEPQGMILLGYPAETGRDPARHTPDEVTLWK